jgi:hypothetical protein
MARKLPEILSLTAALVAPTPATASTVGTNGADVTPQGRGQSAPRA